MALISSLEKDQVEEIAKEVYEKLVVLTQGKHRYSKEIVQAYSKGRLLEFNFQLLNLI